MPPKLSVIIPTIGRSTLENTLRSVYHQIMYEIDNVRDIEVLVIGDTHDDKFKDTLVFAESIARRYNTKYIGHDGGVNCYGHPQRNFGQRIAKGAWLAYLQDDDIYTHGSFRSILASINTHPVCPRLFRTQTWQAGVVWKTQDLTVGNIDADCIVTPNVQDKLGKWEYVYEGDFKFIKQTCEMWNRVLWVDYVIAQGRPNGVGVTK
jgi:glycosyltransferase involved in cell wall biosynthesis